MFLVVAVLMAFLFASPVHAQGHGEFAALAGPVTSGEGDTFFSASFGGEWIGERGLSAGGDGLMIFGVTRARGGATSQLVLSGLVGRHSRRARGAAPFVSGGLSMSSDCCGASLAWTVGGGARFWLTETIGIGTDARLMLGFGEGGLVVGRIGIVFRGTPGRASD